MFMACDTSYHAINCSTYWRLKKFGVTLKQTPNQLWETNSKNNLLKPLPYFLARYSFLRYLHFQTTYKLAWTLFCSVRYTTCGHVMFSKVTQDFICFVISWIFWGSWNLTIKCLYKCIKMRQNLITRVTICH